MNLEMEKSESVKNYIEILKQVLIVRQNLMFRNNPTKVKARIKNSNKTITFSRNFNFGSS